MHRSVFLIFLLTAACGSDTPPPTQSKGAHAGKRILYVDSYHEAYAPNILSRKAFAAGMQPLGVAIRYMFLNTKRSESHTEHCPHVVAILRAISNWRPHLLVAADDAAVKLLVAPHLRGKTLPVIFIGVNWSAAEYGLPAANVTGQIEVDPVEPLLRELQRFARGKRLGFLASESIPDRKSLHWYARKGIVFHRIFFTTTFAEWQMRYRQLQDEVDLLLVRNTSSLRGWDDAQARAFVLAQTRIPTGTINTHQTRLVLLSFAKDNREFGEWAAGAARLILTGHKPSTIPAATNRRARIRINMRMARTLGIRIPRDLLEKGELAEDSP